MLGIASGVIMTGFMMLLPLLPEYADQLGFSEYEIGLLVAAFFFGRVLFQFPLGVLSDYVGRRGIMSASLLLFAAITAAYAPDDGCHSDDNFKDDAGCCGLSDSRLVPNHILMTVRQLNFAAWLMV